MSNGRQQDTSHHVSPRGRIDATPTGRHLLTPRQRTLVIALKAHLAKLGISSTKAGEEAKISPSDARRVLSLTPKASATPRTLRKLFEAFNVDGYEELSEAERRVALALEVHAAAERLAELLGEQAALAAYDPPLG